MTWEWVKQPGRMICPWCGQKVDVEGYSKRVSDKDGLVDTDEREYPVWCRICDTKFTIKMVRERQEDEEKNRAGRRIV